MQNERLTCEIGLSSKREGKIFSQKEGLEKNPEAAHGELLHLFRDCDNGHVNGMTKTA